ncbi:MAG: ATP-binding cassette domain-containing protein [Mycoplasmatales bacterium]|nr:ATP-binding cassette domain-containing protein [Mycoplasmatales bacterium]
MSKTVLEIKNLNKYYVSSLGVNHAVNNVSFKLQKGEILGLIGQSGSGKTTVGRALLRTLTETSGVLSLNDKIYSNFSRSNKKSLPYKKNVQMIYQNPMSALNGLRNIYSTLEEAIKTHKMADENIKELISIRGEILDIYKLSISLNSAKIENLYFKEKLNIINDYVNGFENAKKNNEIEPYLFFDEENINKKIIKLLSSLEDQYTEYFNKKYFDFKDNNKIEKIATLKKKLLEIKEKEKIIKNSQKIKEKIKNDAKKEIRERLNHVIKNMKSFILTTKRVKKSFKEISLNSTDIFRSFNYISRKFIAQKIENIFRSTYKIIKKGSQGEMTLSEKTLKDLIIDITENLEDKIMLEIDSKIDKKMLTNDYKNSIQMAKRIAMEYKFEYKKYLVSISHYEKIIYQNMNQKIKEHEEKIGRFQKIDSSEKRIESLKNQLEKAKLDYQEKEKENTKKIEAEINLLKEDSNKLGNEIKIISKLLQKQSKEALNLYKKEIEAEINVWKEKSSKETDLGKKNEYNLKMKIIRKTGKEKIKKYNVKNQAYEIEKKVLSKNIKKVKIVSGIKKDPSPFKKKNFKSTIITRRIYNILKQVGLKPEHAYRYPNEFSGGQLQRILIARALLVEPEVIVADEPIASLDISIQAQVINLLLNLVKERNISLIFIGHDLSTIEYLCDNILVMHLGRIVEAGKTSEIFKNPIHPYTKVLFDSIPKISEANKPFELFGNVDGYLNDWNKKDKPNFKKINDNHRIFANDFQWKEWSGKKTK